MMCLVYLAIGFLIGASFPGCSDREEGVEAFQSAPESPFPHRNPWRHRNLEIFSTRSPPALPVEFTFDWSDGVPGADLDGVNFEMLERMRDEYRKEFSKWSSIRWFDHICPPASVNVNGGVVDIDHEKPLFLGSDSQLHSSSDGKLLFKTITRDKSPFDGLTREKAVLSVLDSLKGRTARVYSIKPGSESMKHCADRSIVFDYVGGWSGVSLIKDGLKMTESEVARLAARIIEMIRDVHSYGIVHGDIHAGNFVFEGKTNLEGTVKIVDFGRAIPFVNPETGLHVRQNDPLANGFGRLNPVLLSPFEIEGSKLSRRDDMYRLSEVIYKALGYTCPTVHDFGKALSSQELANAKRLWKAYKSDSHRIFTDFHHEMVRLEFTDKPDYQKWIDQFSSI
jgi:hypothetical protein